LGKKLKGCDLTPSLLRTGYLQGVFPMGEDESDEVEWYMPNQRCLFPIEGITVSRSLAKCLKNPKWQVTFDSAFEQVMWSCRRAPGDNWITPEIVRAYTECFEEGWAHSVEVWIGDELVGGSYGLALGKCLAAESMFHKVRDASKVALYHFVNWARENGYSMFDAEVMNPHLKSLGAYTIENSEYLGLLHSGLSL
jgi:leucyl/phenylalanyl-tRNA--protein transferase